MDSLVTRISERHWHALDDDRVVGRGEVSPRPDGRRFLSIDAWHEADFFRLAEAMLASLPKPLYTVVDEDDVALLCRWESLGFGPRRREWEYVMATDPRLTGLGAVATPAGVTVTAPAEAPLRELNRTVRDEVDAAVGWHNMPAEVLAASDLDLSRFIVANRKGEYVGLARIAPLPRQPRIGLIAVRAAFRRQGIGRALLAAVLDAAHRRRAATASADVNQANTAALALFEGIGARRAGSNLELVRR